MRATTTTVAVLAAVLCVPVVVGSASPPPAEQKIIKSNTDATDSSPPPRKLHGRFLHITDLHPDPYYEPHTSTSTCHRGSGDSLPLGTPLSSCDSPFTLINSTFTWLSTHLVPSIDFVIWTGDSARHDHDELIPRTSSEIISTNTQLAAGFQNIFTSAGIPVIPTLGNNDILPHNILIGGPNPWLKRYVEIWRAFVPEEQRHQVVRGGWFYVDVIPGRLAVVSLNTLYFFERNGGVDGCATAGEPGFEHMQWLGVQLEGFRERGVKAVLMGHVPPARTGGKRLWEESCWQAYTLWVRQFRDVVVGAVFGHMNIDHFLLQDTWEVDEDAFVGREGEVEESRKGEGKWGRKRERGGWESLGDEFDARSAGEYLEELRDVFSKLPDPSEALHGDDYDADADEGEEQTTGKKKKRRNKRKKALKEMGGKWAERFQTTLVGPSVVPNYFPSLRVVEYNISGVEAVAVAADAVDVDAVGGVVVHGDGEDVSSVRMDPFRDDGVEVEEGEDYEDEDTENEDEDTESADADSGKQGKKKKHNGKKGKKDRKKKKKKKHGKGKPRLKIPPPPPASAPPGPAYSPQPLSWTGYTQYFANLSAIAEDKDREEGGELEYEVEYSTFNDSKGFGLEDLTVRSYLGLAHRIGLAVKGESEGEGEGEGVVEQGKGGKKKERRRDRAWRVFVERAFVGTRKEVEMGMFGEEEGGGGGEGDREEL